MAYLLETYGLLLGVQCFIFVLCKKPLRFLKIINILCVDVAVTHLCYFPTQLMPAILIAYTSVLFNIIINYMLNYFAGEVYRQKMLSYVVCLQFAVFVVLSSVSIIPFTLGIITISYLLLQLIYCQSPCENRSIKKYFMLADVLFTIALLLLAYESASFNIATIASTSHEILPVALLLLSLVIKTGVFPFHGWLVQSIVAQSPVSGLMHAGCINLGAYVIYLFYPVLFTSAELQLAFISWMLFASILSNIMLVNQIDIKRKLIYSTSGQFSYMYLQAASGFTIGALYHLMLHGFIKAYLFLSQSLRYNQEPLNCEYSFAAKLLLMLVSIALSIILTSYCNFNILIAFLLSSSVLTVIFDFSSLLLRHKLHFCALLLFMALMVACYVYVINLLHLSASGLDVLTMKAQYIIVASYAIGYLYSDKMARWLRVAMPILQFRMHIMFYQLKKNLRSLVPIMVKSKYEQQ